MPSLVQGDLALRMLVQNSRDGGLRSICALQSLEPGALQPCSSISSMLQAPQTSSPSSRPPALTARAPWLTIENEQITLGSGRQPTMAWGDTTCSSQLLTALRITAFSSSAFQPSLRAALTVVLMQLPFPSLYLIEFSFNKENM